MLAFPPDITFVIQLVSFFVLLAILNRLLFVPYAAMLDEREARTEGASSEAVVVRAQADELADRIKTELFSARTEAAEEAEKIRQRTRGEEGKILEAARADAATELEKLRAEILIETDSARTALGQDARALADAMTATVLGTGQSG